MINHSDCDVREITEQDFSDVSAETSQTFIYWVRLCSIVGRIGEHLRQSPSTPIGTEELLCQLRGWILGVSSHLSFPFPGTPTDRYNRQVYELYLPYLSSLSILHMKRNARGIPTAHTIAILAASLVARIFQAFLLRGSLLFLQGMAGWHAAIALLALLHARRSPKLRAAADDDIKVLMTALQDIAKRWDTAKMYASSIAKLLEAQDLNSAEVGVQSDATVGNNRDTRSTWVEAGDDSNNTTVERGDVTNYFPGATGTTTPLFGLLITVNGITPLSDIAPNNGIGDLLYDIFDHPFDSTEYDVYNHMPEWGFAMDEVQLP